MIIFSYSSVMTLASNSTTEAEFFFGFVTSHAVIQFSTNQKPMNFFFHFYQYFALFLYVNFLSYCLIPNWNCFFSVFRLIFSDLDSHSRWSAIIYHTEPHSRYRNSYIQCIEADFITSFCINYLQYCWSVLSFCQAHWIEHWEFERNKCNTQTHTNTHRTNEMQL